MNSETITIIILICQLVVFFIAYIGNNARKRKQSTIEFITSIKHQYRPLREKLYEKFGDRIINVEDIKKDTETLHSIKEILSVLEHLSVGINAKIYDFNIFIRMSGSYFLFLYKTLQPYIEHVQKEQDTAFVEFEIVCKKIEKRKDKYKRKLLGRGRIRYS